METIRWFEAPGDTGLPGRLADYDHHRIDISGTPAVLITYLHSTEPDRGLLAVQHDAAAAHPAAPRWVADLVSHLDWIPCHAPRGAGC